MYGIMKQSPGECVPGRAPVHNGNTTFGAIFRLKHDCSVLFVKGTISAAQQSAYSCSHCIGSVFPRPHFTIGTA